MERIIKFTKRLFIAIPLLYFGLWGLDHFSETGNFIFIIEIFLIPLVLILFVAFLPFYILSTKNKFLPSEENEISKLHIALLFSPHISVVLVFLSSLDRQLSSLPCGTLTIDSAVPIVVSLWDRIIGLFDYIPSILPIIIVVALLITLILLHQKKGRNTSKLLLLELLLFSILALLYTSFAVFDELSVSKRKSVDARRVSDMKQMELALFLYFENKDIYPIVDGKSSYERWQKLEKFLSPEYIPRLPRDPCTEKVKEHSYDYKNSSNGDTYVIKAILGYGTNPALISTFDADGEILGIWCGKNGDELEYCVVP